MCVCNVHMISIKSFHIPTFVCFTTVAIPGIPSHYILNTSSMYEVGFICLAIPWSLKNFNHCIRLTPLQKTYCSWYYYHRIYYGEGIRSDGKWDLPRIRPFEVLKKKKLRLLCQGKLGGGRAFDCFGLINLYIMQLCPPPFGPSRNPIPTSTNGCY